jgi:hypothetical protein
MEFYDNMAKYVPYDAKTVKLNLLIDRLQGNKTKQNTLFTRVTANYELLVAALSHTHTLLPSDPLGKENHSARSVVPMSVKMFTCVIHAYSLKFLSYSQPRVQRQTQSLFCATLTHVYSVHEINHSVLYKPANTEQILRRKPARC